MSNGEEERAARRYMLTNIVRIAAILGVAVGIAIARDAIAAPYWFGVALAVGSVAAFFFAPALMVRRWKEADRGE